MINIVHKSHNLGGLHYKCWNIHLVHGMTVEGDKKNENEEKQIGVI